MNREWQIAAAIDREVMSLESQGLSGERLIEAMLHFLPAFHMLWGRVSDAELKDICTAYPGFCRLTRWMEEYSSLDAQTRKSGTHPFQHLVGLNEPERGEAIRLLQHAMQLSSGIGPAEQHPELIFIWKQDVKRLLDGEFSGPLEREARQALTEAFASIASRL